MNYLGLEKEKVELVGGVLNKLLATYQVHYQKLRNFHWNIKNKSFFVLHEKFEELYNETNSNIDEIAERILTLRLRPLSKLSDYLENSLIEETTGKLNDQQMVEELLKDYTQLIALMREIVGLAADAKDEGTVSLLGEYIAQIEKHCWMLEAWLGHQAEAKSKPVGADLSHN